jgi:hypothetical protein
MLISARISANRHRTHFCQPAFLITNMDESTRPVGSPTPSSDGESIAYGLLRESIQQLAVEVRFLKAEVERFKQSLSAVSQYLIVEKRERQQADVTRDRQLHEFLTRISTASDSLMS